ncbi:hypothetical protein ASPBRDRAFT_492131 [Aspergillus brasiliensis CBS 101740]|uniref:Uncharacterized protein n=1 Tax=Aspergillus brasiliensis (strain CBS 101740 / IMI 381727 / IBT 21946) TaxID=767769 RepID=A0A1L9UN14_ASPBC|nr:hypothetical protein ASPBRDRAFT_492131 [Aspergillus brasiliensis CBS 101740]
MKRMSNASVPMFPRLLRSGFGFLIVVLHRRPTLACEKLIRLGRPIVDVSDVRLQCYICLLGRGYSNTNSTSRISEIHRAKRQSNKRRKRGSESRTYIQGLNPREGHDIKKNRAV